ncbi:ribosome recycling factor [Mycoplasmatota bacterium]|nr:ribosome recycling factor [Mycoplasmatota bacterium]
MNEQADMLLLEIEENMQKSIESLMRDLAAVRTGRANPSLLDHVKVDYYGAESPIRQISSVTIVEGNQLYIKPFDKSILKSIETAIYASDLGLNPLNDGYGIRLILPQPTEERRRQLVKDVDKLGEHAKIAIRNIRRDGNVHVKKLELSEDDEKGYLEDVQSLTDQFVKKVEAELKEKEQELMKM